MWILARSIARHFLTNALLLFVFLCVVIMAVDVSLNIDEFVKGAKNLLESQHAETSAAAVALRAAGLVADLWWPRVFLLFNYLLGPVLLGALGFTGSYLMKHRELVAMISSGISLRRVAMPVLLCTLALLGAQVACKELVLPRLAPLLVRDKQDIGPQSGAMTRSFLRDTEGRIWYIQRADIDPRSPDRATLRNISVYERDEQGLMTRRITASSAEWEAQGDALSTEHHWALTGGVAAARVRADSSAGPAARVQNSPAYEIRSSVTPTTLRHYRWDSMASNLSSPQLRELIASTRSGAPTPAEVRREHNLTRLLYGRWSNTLCVLLSVIMGLPFFLRKEPANMVRQTLIAAPQSLAAFALTLVGTTADMPGIPPGVSVFLPAMFLLPAAIVAWGSIKT